MYDLNKVFFVTKRPHIQERADVDLYTRMICGMTDEDVDFLVSYDETYEVKDIVCYIRDWGLNKFRWLFNRVYLLKGHDGEEVELEHLLSEWRSRYEKPSYRDYQLSNWSRRGGGHYMKNPKSTHERRYGSQPVVEDGEPRVRGKRTFRCLPNAYDDKLCSDIGLRNWKKYRKTQYKPK